MIVRLMLVAPFLAPVATAARAQDVAAGEKSFNKCRACHQVGEAARTAPDHKPHRRSPDVLTIANL